MGSAPATGLPRELTTFVGRATELVTLRKLLDGARLVTVLGPAGVGKTRLATELGARASQDALPVCFCDLSETTTVDGVCSAIGAALDVRLGGGAGVTDALAAAIADRGAILLVLDNAEQVAAWVAKLIDGWLRRAPAARFLVTSRERLGVAGEVLFDLEPLPLPVEGENPRDADAFALFVDRARLVRRGWDPVGEEAATVAAIVRDLDGLPLAIELGAARLRVLSPTELLAALGKRFDVLRSSVRGAVERQATLLAAIDGSFRVLSSAERTAFTQCSVFRGGFTLDAARSVIDLSTEPDAPELLDVLQSLRDRSLLHAHATEGSSGAMRLGMYASIRDFAADRLAELGADAVRAVLVRHARHYLEVGRAWAVRYESAAEPDAGRFLSREEQNLIAVHHRALDANALLTPDGASIALEAALALGPMLLSRGPTTLASALFDSAITAADDSVPAALRAKALLGRAHARRLLGNPGSSLGDLERARALVAPLDEPTLAGRVQLSLGDWCYEAGRLDDAARHHARALEIARGAHDRKIEGRALGGLGAVHAASDRLAEGRRDLEAALETQRAVGDRISEGVTLGNLGGVEHAAGRAQKARAWYEAALAHHRQTGHRRHEGVILGFLARLLHEEGELDRARECYEQALVIARAVGHKRQEGVFLGCLGSLLADSGDGARADACYAEALPILHEVGEAAVEALVLALRSVLRSRAGDFEAATEDLEGAAKQLPGPDRHGFAAVIELCRGELDLARGQRDAAVEHMDRARASAAGSSEVRIALRALERQLARATPAAEEPPADTLVVATSGAWFRPPGGARVSLGRRVSLRRLVARLAAERADAPGASLDWPALLESAWPGEAPRGHSGATRVHVALSTLRKLGLRGLLQRDDHGYLLDPRVPLVRVGDDG